MSKSGSPKSEAHACLKNFGSLLEKRNVALARLSKVSHEMRASLRQDPSADIKSLLELRQKECLGLADVSESHAAGDDALLLEAERAAGMVGNEVKATADWVISLYSDSQALAQDVMTCQAECEVILKERLKAVSRALHTSAQRRKLDAAYGPAHRHDTPVFLDRQR